MAVSPDFLHEITASFAQPAAENPTVEMIEAAYRFHGLHWRYINFEVAPDDLAAAVAGARAMGFAGFNCSIPHKVSVIPLLDGLGQSAEIIGAVNCVVRRDHKYIGENTDGKGFLKSLCEQVDPQGKTLVLLGAGGAARAIGVETAIAGVTKIYVVNRNATRGEKLTQLLNEKTPATAEYVPWHGTYLVAEDADIVVNATSVGLYPNVKDQLDISMTSLQPSMLVADVIPNPLRTEFLQAAEAIGCVVINGLGMLVNQGVISIKYWTGADVEPSVMRDRVKEVLNMP